MRKVIGIPSSRRESDKGPVSVKFQIYRYLDAPVVARLLTLGGLHLQVSAVQDAMSYQRREAASRIITQYGSPTLDIAESRPRMRSVHLEQRADKVFLSEETIESNLSTSR